MEKYKMPTRPERPLSSEEKDFVIASYRAEDRVAELEKSVSEFEESVSEFEKREFPIVTVTIDGISIKNINKHYYDISIGELVQAHKEERERERLEAYLEKQYGGDLHYSDLANEILLPQAQINVWLREELGKTTEELQSAFIPIPLVAELVLWANGV